MTDFGIQESWGGMRTGSCHTREQSTSEEHAWAYVMMSFEPRQFDIVGCLEKRNYKVTSRAPDSHVFPKSGVDKLGNET